jgi:Putative zinc-finger
MICEKVLPLLSEYFDEVLDSKTSSEVSQHLDRCVGCRKELSSLVAVHNKLRSTSGAQAPDYLRNLVQLRLADIHKNSWRAQLLDELERRWSQIRTTEGMWYLTRALGTAMTVVFLIFISTGINPIYVEATSPAPERLVLTSASSKKNVIQNLQANFGILPAQIPKGPVHQSQPAINDLYFVNYIQSLPKVDSNDTFAVGIEVDQRGSAKIQRVLEQPSDKNLLSNFAEMISSSRWRPGSKNGQAVTSQLVLIISKIIVYD